MSTASAGRGHIQSSAKVDSGPRYDHLFNLYNAKSEEEDQEFLTDCNDAMDSLLVFAGLFSAVTTALIVESYQDLKPDQSSRTEQLLAALLQRSGDPSASYEPPPPAQFSATATAIVTNSLFFLSLCVSLLAALSAILVKQWARNFLTGLRQISSAPRRARKRFQRSHAVDKWGFIRIIAWVPMMLHLSLVLFFAGLIVWLWSLNKIIFSITITLAGVACILYLGGATITSFDPNAPFEWPMAALLRKTILRAVTKTQASTQDTIPLIQRNTTTSLMITTPLDSFDSATYDSSSQPPTQLDMLLISDFLHRADTYIEVEAALQQLYQIIAKSEVQLHEVPSDSVNTFIRCAADLILACSAYDHNLLTIQRGVGFQRATTAIQFLEAILQVISIDLDACGEFLRSATRMIRLYHARTLELKDPGLIALSASCLARIASQLDSDAEVVSLVETAPELMSTLIQLGPKPIGLPISSSYPAAPAWAMERVRQYQVSITAYLASFIQLLATCDSRGLKLDTEAVNKVFENAKRLMTNSRLITIKGSGIKNHPILLDFLKIRWCSLYGPPTDQFAPRLIAHLLSNMAQDAVIVDGGRHEVHPKQPKLRSISRTVDAH